MDNIMNSMTTSVISTVTPSLILPNPLAPIDIGLTCAASSLSIVGAILIFTAYCSVNTFRPENETRRLLLYLTISDLLVACGNLMGTLRYVAEYHNQPVIPADMNTKDMICVVQSFITTTANMWSFFWTTAIAIHLVVALIYCRDRNYPITIKVLCHVVGWFVPCKC